ncbi:MAG: GWxTD domain-containing protein [Calditrichaeota bacterium]|nr:MAG: hypothetical protein DWQ03_13740 [Calditrichota bacterium]MBL1206308.1 GWxTD domain-containing protein [Calditrichota bacterium]NOG46134.1 GWxTD domain-containing protein [Calditrichota bacterium]
MKKSFLIIFFLVINTFGQEYQQDFQKITSRYGYEIYRPAYVGFNYFVDYQGTDWQPLLYLTVSIQNDFLQFTRTEGKFTTEFQITVTIRDEQKTLLSKTWQQKEKLLDFEKTNSRKDFQKKNYKIVFADEGLDIVPGEYEVHIEVHDLLSSREYKNKRKLVIAKPNENPKFSASAIAFFSHENNENETELRLSSTRNLIEFNSPYNAMATIEMPDVDSLGTNIRVYKRNDSEKSLISQTFIKQVANKSGIFELSYALPYKMLEEGDYLIRFSFGTAQDDFEIERQFSVAWLSKPLYLYRSDLAIRPMKYLLSEEQIEEVKELKIEELDNWFTAFWKERDPSPNTTYNELLDEFYKRVTEAVRQYSNRFKEGWQTDRGRILLLYGEPTEVENRKYSVNSVPHIIWKYTDKNGEMVFTFVDKNKTGIFTLIDEETGQN